MILQLDFIECLPTESDGILICQLTHSGYPRPPYVFLSLLHSFTYPFVDLYFVVCVLEKKKKNIDSLHLLVYLREVCVCVCLQELKLSSPFSVFMVSEPVALEVLGAASKSSGRSRCELGFLHRSGVFGRRHKRAPFWEIKVSERPSQDSV